MKETARYVGPDGEALHPGDRIGLEPPGCLKRDDRLDAWLTALRHELARACELPEKAMFGDDLPDNLPPGGGGLGPWRWLGLDALKIKNPEVQLLGKDDSKMLDAKGIGEAELLAALFNAAKPDRTDVMNSKVEKLTVDQAAEILDAQRGEYTGMDVTIRKLYGRVIETTFKKTMGEIDCTRYDAHNGQGTMAEVVDKLHAKIATRKNAERRAKIAKRHRVAVYWEDGSGRMDVAADGELGQCIDAAAMLLGNMLALVEEDRRKTTRTAAFMKVDDTIRKMKRENDGEDDE